MAINTITSISDNWKASFDSYTIEAEKNIAVWVAENAKQYRIDRLSASTCPARLSWYDTDFSFFFWEQVNQWIQAEGLNRETCDTVLKPSNGLYFEDVVNHWYARVAEKHQINFIRELIECELVRLRSEDGIDEEY